MTALYNEIDPYAAQWLRNLIQAGHIADGFVDERSICDLTPADVAGFTQVHFFAGIGGWSFAARLAGWPDDRPLWTGSCPCQPFSVAGAGKGQADVRHLWPEFHRLIAGCRPPVVMGEQVAAAVGKSWLDGVCSDLEGIGYTTGAAVVPACAVDAPHRRDRLWFVAERESKHGRSRLRIGDAPRNRDGQPCDNGGSDGAVSVADAHEQGLAQREGDTGVSREGRSQHEGQDASHVHSALAPGGCLADPAGIDDRRRASESHAGSEPQSRIGGVEVDMADTEDAGRQTRRSDELRTESGHEQGLAACLSRESFWSDSTLCQGADGKARRVKPGVRLLAHGVPARVGKLRAFGNAIVPAVAAEIIGAYLDATAVLNQT